MELPVESITLLAPPVALGKQARQVVTGERAVEIEKSGPDRRSFACGIQLGNRNGIASQGPIITLGPRSVEMLLGIPAHRIRHLIEDI